MMVALSVIKQIHDQTGAGYLDVKRMLEKTNGDIGQAIEAFREKGFSIAQKKAHRITKAGVIAHYLHNNGRIGVMLEVNCETESAAATKVFQDFTHQLAMHIAAMNPACIAQTDLLPSLICEQKTRCEAMASSQNGQGTENIIAVEAMMQEYYRVHCLLDQPYFKDPSLCVQDVLIQCIAKLRENITITRFIRYEVGEPA